MRSSRRSAEQTPDRDRLLPLALMKRPRHQPLQEELVEVLLVAPDQHHRGERIEQPLDETCGTLAVPSAR